MKYPTIGLVRTNVYSLQEWVSAGAIGLAREAWVYFAVWPLVLAPFGFYLVARQERGRRLAVLGAAGLGAGIVFALIGVVADMHVRYPLFLLPFVAMGCGIVLDVLWERGRWARIVVIGLLMLTLLFSASLWKFFI